MWCSWTFFDTSDPVPLSERERQYLRDSHVRTCHSETDIEAEIGYLSAEIAGYGHLPEMAARLPAMKFRRDNLLRIQGLPGRRPWRPSDGESRCQSCGGMNPVWHTDNLVWNRVVGGTEREAPGILCPSCFLIQAEARGVGITGAWHLVPPPPRHRQDDNATGGTQ